MKVATTGVEFGQIPMVAGPQVVWYPKRGKSTTMTSGVPAPDKARGTQEARGLECQRVCHLWKLIGFKGALDIRRKW